MTTKELHKRGKRWQREGWLSVSLRDFGLGFHFHRYRGRSSSGITINLYLLFIDFHLELWRRR